MTPPQSPFVAPNIAVFKLAIVIVVMIEPTGGLIPEVGNFVDRPQPLKAEGAVLKKTGAFHVPIAPGPGHDVIVVVELYPRPA